MNLLRKSTVMQNHVIEFWVEHRAAGKQAPENFRGFYPSNFMKSIEGRNSKGALLPRQRKRQYKTCVNA
jgi:hypothetical protein